MRDENSNNEREEAGTRVRRAAELQQLEVSAAAAVWGSVSWRNRRVEILTSMNIQFRLLP